VVERKTKKTKTCPINKTAAEVLQNFLDERPSTATSGEPLFVSRKGNSRRSISRQHAHQRLNAAAREVGLPNIGTHSLRKTFGYHVFKRSGGNLALVQKLLNHGNAAETLRYIGIEQEDIDKAYLELNLG
jgi:site-specific recombinase XerD